MLAHPEHGSIQLGRSCVERYTGASPALALACVDLLVAVTAELTEHQDLPEGEADPSGPDLRDYAVGLLCRLRGYGAPAEESDYVRADEAVTLAESVLIPGLRELRAETAAREAGQTYVQPEEVQTIPERWVNLAVIVACGCVPIRDEAEARRIFDWVEEHQRNAEARALAGDPQAALGALIGRLQDLAPAGSEPVGSDPKALASALLALLADPTGKAARRLAATASMIATGEAAPVTPPTQGEWLAAVGAVGTWRATVVRQIPYSARGGGCVVKLAVETPDGPRPAVAFVPRNHALATVRGTVVVRGTVAKHNVSQWGREAQLDGVTVQ